MTPPRPPLCHHLVPEFAATPGPSVLLIHCKPLGPNRGPLNGYSLAVAGRNGEKDSQRLNLLARSSFTSRALQFQYSCSASVRAAHLAPTSLVCEERWAMPKRSSRTSQHTDVCVRNFVCVCVCCMHVNTPVCYVGVQLCRILCFFAHCILCIYM